MSASAALLADMIGQPPEQAPTPLYGTTARRPVAPPPWTAYGDTDLGIPIWWNETDWIDATGAIV